MRWAAVMILSAGVLLAQAAVAATTGLEFAGGCPGGEASNTGLCDQGGNADAANVAALLGINEALVTQIGEIAGPTGSGSGFSVTSGDGGQTGTWSVFDPAITHLAFKADTYFILGRVTTGSGTWEMDPAAWDLTLATCPATICTVVPGPRAYVAADFLNGGGQVADLGNVRAFSVVPLPGAVWLFGSGLLGLMALSRRKSPT